jgi:hypothetical protein
MWNPISALFGSPKTVGKLVDGALSGLDKLKFTPEERADAERALLPVITDWMKGTQAQDVARRMLALIVATPWGVNALVMVGFATTGKSIEPLVAVMNGSINTPFMLVMAFYFAPHAITAVMKGTRK